MVRLARGEQDALHAGGPPDSGAGRLLWREAMGKREAESHRHVAQAILDGDRELGTLAEAYAHAVAARALAREPGELNGAGVERDAGEVLRRLRGRLSAADRAHADSLGVAWASAYPIP